MTSVTIILFETTLRAAGGGGGGKIRGLGPRNDVLNLQSGHPAWWSAGNRCFSHTKCFDKLEASRQEEMIKTLKIISCIFVFLAYRICLLVLKSRRETKPPSC